MMPSHTRETTMSPAPAAARIAPAPCDKKSIASSKYSFSISPMKKVRKKTTAMMQRNTGILSQLLVSILST